jgi:hypothetical protein
MDMMDNNKEQEMTWRIDNRFAAGNSGAEPSTRPAAMYGARWIDQGNNYPADVVSDRQGFAYDSEGERDSLIGALIQHDKVLRSVADLSHGGVAVYNLPVEKGVVLSVGQRRAGGYIYVDAWLQGIESAKSIEPTPKEMTLKATFNVKVDILANPSTVLRAITKTLREGGFTLGARTIQHLD